MKALHLIFGVFVCAVKFPWNFLTGLGVSQSNLRDMRNGFGLLNPELDDEWQRIYTNNNGRGYLHNVTTLPIDWAVANRPLSIKFLCFLVFALTVGLVIK